MKVKREIAPGIYRLEELAVKKAAKPATKICRGCMGAEEWPEEMPKPELIQIPMPIIRRADNHGSHYNCSILEWHGKTLMASRLGWHGSEIWLCELENWQPVGLRQLNITHPNIMQGVEDPRLFIFQGQVHVAASGYDKTTKAGTSQIISSLDKNLQVEKTWIPRYHRRKEWEKNWATWGGDFIHSVYEINQGGEHVVLKHVEEQAIDVARTKHNYSVSTMRGGASPVQVGGEMYHWYHTVSVNRGVTTYGLSLYTFAATHPFQILRKVAGVMYTSDNPVYGWIKNVIFPCGAILKDGHWYISCGHQDRECLILKYKHADIERILK